MVVCTRLFLVCLLAARATALLRSRANGSTEVQQTNAKFVFFAGLEGTGHHILKDALLKCMEAGACGRMADDFYDAVYWYSMTSNMTAMKKAWKAAKVEGNVVYPLNPFKFGNMMSYPTLREQYMPHMEELYRAATHFGHEFKVVVMLRNPRSLLRSVSERFHHTEDTLVAALDEISAQLRELPADVYCVKYGELGMAGAELQEFMGVSNFNLGAALHNIFQARPGCDSGKAEGCADAPKLAEADRKFRKEFCPDAF